MSIVTVRIYSDLVEVYDSEGNSEVYGQYSTDEAVSEFLQTYHPDGDVTIDKEYHNHRGSWK